MAIEYHDDFMEKVRKMIKNISDLKKKGDIKGAAKESLKLANAKVAYYEQFINADTPFSNYSKDYLNDYENALKYRAEIRDYAADLGIFEE